MNKSVVKSVIFLAILLLTANVAACSNTPTNESKPAQQTVTSTPGTAARDEIKPTQQNIDATKDYQTYENAAYALKIKYPKDWEKREESGIIVGFMSPGVSNVNLVTEDLSKSPNMQLDEYVKLSLTNIEKQLNNFNLIENTPMTMGNVKAQKIVYTANAEGFDLKFMQVLTIVNSKAFVLTYTSTPGDFDKDLSTAQNIFGSFTI